MKINVRFTESNQTFDADFGEVQTADDGGFERGYAAGYDKGHAEGYGKGVAEVKLNVSGKETLTFSKLVDANMTVLYTSSCDVEVIRLAGTRGGVGALPVIELYDDDTLIYRGSASQSMEYIDLLPLRQNRSICIKKTSGDSYTGKFTLQTIKINQIKPISELN